MLEVATADEAGDRELPHAARYLALVNNVPDSPDDRQALLERWGEEQREQYGKQDPGGPQLRTRVAGMIETVRGLNVRRLETYVDQVVDHGLDTRGRWFAPEVDPHEGLPYVPSPWHVLPRALRAIRASEADVFVDLGCGKGRVVHQAARWPLKRVIGVEISPELAGFARAVIAAHRHEYRCHSVEIIVCDARGFQVPDDLTIAYLYASFHGETLDVFLRHLVDSIDRHPRQVRLIYVQPSFGDQVLATGRFRLVRWQRGGLSDTRISRAAIFESHG